MIFIKTKKYPDTYGLSALLNLSNSFRYFRKMYFKRRPDLYIRARYQKAIKVLQNEMNANFNTAEEKYEKKIQIRKFNFKF